jgi:hypothetical protein
MSARNDVHSPLNLVTEDYEYLFAWDSGTPGCLVGIAQSDAWREWHANGPVEIPGREVSSSQCTHCGAHIRYVALLRYVPTGQYLYVGETCLDNRFGRATADFHQLRKQAQLDREQQRLLTAWNDYKAQHPGVNFDLLATSTNPFICDVLGKGRKYGNLSDRQLDAIVKAFERDVQREIEQALRVEAPKADCPEGKRLTITGRLVSRKWKETQFGSVEKCLVVVDTSAGEYKVWGSIPQALYNQGVAVGDLVTFCANVEVSPDDASFGFYSRPTKAQVLSVPVDAPTPVVEQALADGWDPQTQVLDLEEVNYDDYEPICGQLHAHNDTCYA